MQYIVNEKHKKIIVSATLPSLNEYLAACGRNPRIGGKMKAQAKFVINCAVRKCIGKWHTDKKIIIHYHFYEPNMKRDKDNIFAFTSKTVQDSLQECNVIDNDGWKNVENFTHDFFVDKVNPRIEIYIEEI